jgi:phosphopantothenoylcysteine decarboxylase/phosphopantothenate--cysteine ligase
MHTEMWNNPATVHNIQTLRNRGVVIVGPGVGRLTGSDSGAGRMEEPDVIVAAALAALHPATPARDLSGRRIVITAGGTREPLDPVRFLGNRSSGKQGVRLAEAATARGASVVLLAANLEIPVPAGIETRLVGTALELQAAVTEAAVGADAVIMAAAVADYRPATVRGDKIKKEDEGDTLTLELVRNPDILAGLAAAKTAGQLVIGFAAETEADPDRLLSLGREKLARKGCDYLVLNRVGWTEGFAAERNEVRIIDSAGDIVAEAAGTKMSVAGRILDVVVAGLG